MISYPDQSLPKLEKVMELPMKAYKDKEATAAAKNMQEGLGKNKTLVGCYGKGYFGSSCFRLANEFRRVAAHVASFYNLRQHLSSNVLL